MKKRAALAVLASLLLASSARAGVTGLGGLEAVALRPDGKLLAVGGQNRVIYLVGTDTLAVTQRLYLGTRIGALAFSRDGKRLVVEDETDRLRLLELPAGKEIARVDNVAAMGLNPAGDRIVARDTLALTKLRLLALEDLDDRGSLLLPDRPAAWAFEPGGKRLTVLSMGLPGEEERVPFAKIPADLKGLARAEFQQKHDGHESYLRTLDLETGKVVRQAKLWFTSDSDSTLLVRAGDAVRVYNRSNVCARIAADNKVTLFQTEQRYNHGLGVSANGKHLFTGGLAEGWLGPPAGGLRVRFEIAPLPGQDEFLSRFAVRGDGSAYAVTTAFRVVKISKEGRVEKVAAVY
jgi:hypothetical protein